jgi:aldose 1-epimerase
MGADMGVAVSRAGEFEGKRVDEAVLVSDAGVEVCILNYGVTVRDWRVPVAGGLRSIVLGFESFDPYPEHSPYFGAIAGRVANRVRDAEFSLNGHSYALDANDGGNQLHGGPKGLSHQIWNMEPDSASNAVRFTHFSPDGAMGYPGNVGFEAVYRLNGESLELEMSAETDVPTPISLVQHIYFNLGTGADVLDHVIRIPGTAHTELGAGLVTTGAILPVDGTVYDFRDGRKLRDENGAPIDYDFNLVLDPTRKLTDPIAEVASPDGALKLTQWSDQKGLQVYNGIWTDVSAPGLGGRQYGKYSGLCLEDQAFPDALHHPNFPSIISDPAHPYQHRCRFEVGSTSE